MWSTDLINLMTIGSIHSLMPKPSWKIQDAEESLINEILRVQEIG